jgi:Putative peptidoglycan binding domain
MKNKLLVSIAVLAAGIGVASCEKTPSGESAGNQSGSPTAEGQQSQSAQSQQPGAEEPGGQSQPQAQQHSSQTTSQAPPSSQAQASQEDRTSGPNQSSPENAPGPGGAQPNQPQQRKAQLNEQKSQPGPNQQASGGAAGGALNLGRDQVRQAQVALKEKGFDVGELDGVLGPRTRKALIAFQRQQGSEPSGQFDQRTATALGISNGPGPTTSGHSGGAQ